MQRGEDTREQGDSYETYSTGSGIDRDLVSEQQTSANQAAGHPPSQYTQEDTNQNEGDNSVARALLQLRSQRQNEHNSNQPQLPQASSSAPNMTNFYYHMDQHRSRSETETQSQLGMQQRNIPCPADDANMSNSEVSIKETISSLSATISSMQQQQAYMATALGYLTTTIQGMRNDPQPQRGVVDNTAYSTGGAGQVQQGYQSNQVGSDSSSQQVTAHNNHQEANSFDQTRQQRWTENTSLTNTVRYRNNPTGNYTEFHQQQGVDEESQQYWPENRPLYNTRNEWQAGRQQVSGQRNSSFLDAKLPPFNGKEDWKVWLNRFEAVANRRQWDDDAKLDNLLPKLQGRAGDFVFTQLSNETISCYPQLVKELNSRFRVVETQKTYAARFSQRTQRHDETVEEYAAELKRLYSKAYKNRDESTRREDLVRRFLDGLKDSEASFEIEFHKEPNDIDLAVYHAANFIQTKRRGNSEAYHDKKFKRYARRANYEDETDDSESEYVGDDRNAEETLPIMRLPSKDEQRKSKPQKGEHRKEDAQPKSDSLTEVKEMLKSLAGKVDELQKDSTPRGNMKQDMPVSGKSGVLCYACKERGHISRDCPSRQNQRQRSDANVQQRNQGRVQTGSGQNTGPLN